MTSRHAVAAVRPLRGRDVGAQLAAPPGGRRLLLRQALLHVLPPLQAQPVDQLR